MQPLRSARSPIGNKTMFESYSIHLRQQVTRFILLFVGRTGSTYIISKLNTHPNVCALGEKLVDFTIGETEAQLNWVEKFLRPPLAGRNKAIGFKTKFVDIFDPGGFAQVVRTSQSKIIYLRRQNHIKAVVSRLNSDRLWKTSKEWHLYDETNRLPPFVIEPNDFDQKLKHRLKVDSELDNYVKDLRLPILSLSYEELLLNESVLFERIFTFLNVNPKLTLKGNTIKNTPDDLSKIMINFDEIRLRYEGTQFESMFDEILVPALPE